MLVCSLAALQPSVEELGTSFCSPFAAALYPDTFGASLLHSHLQFWAACFAQPSAHGG